MPPGSEDPKWNRAISVARARWPAISLSEADFMDHVRAREELRHVFETHAHIDELYLCVACAKGDGGALREFENTYFSELGVVLKKMGATASAASELRQLARHHLFVAHEGATTRIEGYTASGSLRKWVRVVMTRFAINALSRVKPEIPTEDEFLDRLVGGNERDPELMYMKGLYRDRFREAFRESLAQMSDSDQTLLKCAFQQHLSIDAIASLHAIHRSTAARRVLKVRDELLRNLRATLMQRLQISDDEYESIFRFVRSQLDVDL